MKAIRCYGSCKWQVYDSKILCSMYCAGVRGKKPTTSPALLNWSAYSPAQTSHIKHKSFSPHPLLFNRCLACISFQELFPEKLAVAVSLTSTYSNKSLTRMSPFRNCSNQLHPMQNAVCKNIFLSTTVVQRWLSSDLILFSLLLWLILWFSSNLFQTFDFFIPLISTPLLFHFYTWTLH